MADTGEAAKKVLSGRFAYVSDTAGIDKVVASSGGALAKKGSTILAAGFSLAGYAVKKD